MAFSKYLLPVVVVTQVVFASRCGDFKISSQSDADILANCSTVDGDINIDKDYSGNLYLRGITQVRGSITCDNCSNLASLHADSISAIGGDLQLFKAVSLTSLEFSQLTTVLGTVELVALSSLQSLGFTAGVTKAGGVHIENTKLANLNGISPKTISRLTIRANQFLKSAKLNSLMNVTDEAEFFDNYDGLEVELLSLSSGTNMTFHSVKDVSIPSLHRTSGSLTFSNCQFESLSAPNLTSAGDLTFFNNTQLSNISLPVLQQVNGGFNITNFDPLKNITLPSLEKVPGFIDFNGDFDTLRMSKLDDVYGAFRVRSTGNIEDDCSWLMLYQNLTIRGMMQCKEESDHKTHGDVNTTSTTSGGVPSATSTSNVAAISRIHVPAVSLVAAVFYALARLF
ncbi:protein ecm33 [Aspergillus ambiguus]|uniref:protein ecm33 n=1 Tax=Aspergillus ambiguus TaxID=176160 RepID=UPI003CCD4CF6